MTTVSKYTLTVTEEPSKKAPAQIRVTLTCEGGPKFELLSPLYCPTNREHTTQYLITNVLRAFFAYTEGDR